MKKLLTIHALSFFILFANMNVFAENGNQGFLIKDDADKAIIPFQYIDNFIVLPVKFNHGKTLNLILDTGIRSIVLFNKKTAYKIGLFADREVVFAGAGLKNNVDGFVTNQVIVSLPRVQAKGVSVVTLEKAFSQLHNIGIDGAMGYQIFSRFIVEIDYQNKFLVLHNDKRFELDSGYTQIPIIVEDTRPYLNAHITDNAGLPDLKLMIDTGFNNELIIFKNKKTSQTIRRLKKDPFYRTLGKGLAGNIKGKLASNFSLYLQNVPFEANEVFLPRSNVYELDDQRDGTIGNKLLSKNMVIIDYINGYLYIRPHYYRKSLDKIIATMSVNSWY